MDDDKNQTFARYLEKDVFIKTKTRKYSGRVHEIHDSGNGLVFISIIDKFGAWVTFSSQELESIEMDKSKEGSYDYRG